MGTKFSFQPEQIVEQSFSPLNNEEGPRTTTMSESRFKDHLSFSPLNNEEGPRTQTKSQQLTRKQHVSVL